MADLDVILTRALDFAKGAVSEPQFTKGEFESAMLSVADSERRSGETMACSLARLCREGDGRMRALGKAIHGAEIAEAMDAERLTSEEIRELRDLHFGAAGATPPLGSRLHIAALMETVALEKRRAAETVAEAFDRLLREDPVMRAAYDAYNDAAAV